jgi:hypothetical protein
MRHLEKQRFLLLKMGGHLLGQRQAVFCETQEQFAQRLVRFGDFEATAQQVDSMEKGDPTVAIASWICAWQVMQVADAVAHASKSDAALFLAAAKHAPGIEQEIALALNKKESS